MKIQTKLFLLLFIMFSVMSLSLAGFMIFQKFVDITEQEKSDIISLENSILAEHIELSKFLYDKVVIKNQVEQFNLAIDSKQQSLINISKIDILPKLSKVIRSSINSIFLLEDQQVVSQNKLINKIEELLIIVKDFRGSIISFTLNETYTKLDLKKSSFKNLQKSVKEVKKEIVNLEIALYRSEKTIAEQFDIINRQINKIQIIGFYIIVSFAIISFIISLLIALDTARKISTSIKSLSSCLTLMASGNLTQFTEIKTNDEIGILSKNMNIFQKSLNKSLNQIKMFSNRNDELKNELINTATETASSSVQISANINSINIQTKLLDDNISITNRDIKEITTISYNLSD